MPQKGQILINPFSGDTYEFMDTAHDTNGQSVTVLATVNHVGQLVPNHFHVLQDEYFEVLSGELTIWTDNNTKVLSAGESILLPRNKAHNHYNAGISTTQYIHTVTPALDFDYFLETLVGLASDGKSKNGNPGLIQNLVSLKYLDGKSYLTNIPIGVQKILMNTIAPIGRLLGYRAIYKKYSGIEK